MLGIFKKGKGKIKDFHAESQSIYDLGEKWITANKKAGMESPEEQRLLGELNASFGETDQISFDNLDKTADKSDEKARMIKGQIDGDYDKYDAISQRMDEISGHQSELDDEDTEKLLADIMQGKIK